jgi:hypothetical protein
MSREGWEGQRSRPPSLCLLSPPLHFFLTNNKQGRELDTGEGYHYNRVRVVAILLEGRKGK